MSLLRKIWLFYYEGFRSMTVGRKLWAIIIIKLVLFFLIMKMIFFPNLLNTKYDNDQDRSDHVHRELVKPGQ